MDAKKAYETSEDEATEAYTVFIIASNKAKKAYKAYKYANAQAKKAYRAFTTAEDKAYALDIGYKEPELNQEEPK